ncbi:hypothetical protein Bca101_036620 [Brassica carinata]
MRLVTKDEEAAAMSDFPVEEEEEKSDVVDEEGKGSFYESAKKGGDAVRETVKECSIVIEREILKSGLGYENPGRRLTRSMFKSECINSKANVDVDEDLMNPEREAKDSCAAEGSKSEANGSGEDHLNAEREAEDTCVAEGSKFDHRNTEKYAKTSGLRRCGVKKAVNDTVDRPLRRLTSSLVKQDSPDLESNTGSSDLGKVDVHANDVDMDDFQNPLVTTPNKRGRPRKFIRSFPAKLKELFDSRILEGLTVYYLRCAKMREAGARGLKGVIKGSGILCFRGACKGTQVVSPAVYEHHASSTNKRSPEYLTGVWIHAS